MARSNSKATAAAAAALEAAVATAAAPATAPVVAAPAAPVTPMAGVSVGGYSTPAAPAVAGGGWVSVGVADPGVGTGFTGFTPRPMPPQGKRVEAQVYAPTLQAPGGQTEFTLLGHSLSAVCRWLGSHHVTPKQAEKAVRVWLGDAQFSPHTIRTQLQHGRHGRHGLPQLGDGEAAQLLAAARG